MKRYLLADLFSFVAVIHAGSFTQAAKQLGVTHSVLSKRIKRLEEQLKTTLLNRTTRQLHLTSAGQRIFQKCENIKQDVDSVISNVNLLQEEPHEMLRIHAPMSFGQLHLASALSDFIKQYPRIQIELILGSHHLNLIEHAIDVGIYIKELPDSSLKARKIGMRSMLVCGSPEYFAKHGIPKKPQDLTKHNCLLYQLHSQQQKWRFRGPKGNILVKVKGNLSINSSQALASAAVAGLGIAKLPGYMINRELHQGKLISVLKEFCPKDIGIYAAYPYTKNSPVKVKLLTDFLAQRFDGEKYWNETLD